MGMEASELAVRLRLLQGSAFEAEANAAADSLGRFREEADKANAANTASSTGGGPLALMERGSEKIGKASTALDKFSKKAHQVARTTLPVSAASAFGIFESMKVFMGTESSFRLLESQAHATRQMRKELEGAASAYAHFGFGPTEVAEAFYPLQSVLQNVKADEDAMGAAAMGAAIGHDTLAHSAEALIAIWKSGHVGVKSYREEMALLDETVGAGKMRLPELMGVANTRLFPVAAGYGIDQRAILGVLAGASQGLSEGGVESFASVFRTTLSKGIGLKGQDLAAAKKLGLESSTIFNDYHSGPLGLITMLRQLNARKHSLGEAEWAKDVTTMFGGSRSAGSIFQVLQALPSIEAITKGRLDNVHGSSTLEMHMRQTEQTSAQKLKVLKAEFEGTEYQLGKLFTPGVMSGLHLLLGFMEKVTHGFEAMPKPLRDLVTWAGLGAVALSPLSYFASGVAKVFSLLLSPLKGALGLIMSLAETYLPGLRLALGETATATETAGAEIAAGGAEAAAGGAAGGAGGLLSRLGGAGALGLGARALGVAGGVYLGGEVLSRAVLHKSLWDAAKLDANFIGSLFDGGSSHRAYTKHLHNHRGGLLEAPVGTFIERNAAGGRYETATPNIHIESHSHLYLDGQEMTKAVEKNLNYNKVTRQIQRSERFFEARG